MHDSLPVARVAQQIYWIRDQKVMLDADLADLYGVQTRNLNKAVKRNIERFPPHFMFRLTNQEFKALMFQIGTSNVGRGGRRDSPYAFTEQGVAMLSSVLRSKRAIQVNIVIMDTFVRLRQMMTSHEELARKIRELESKYDRKFLKVFEAIQQLMSPPHPPKKPRIGF
jgi:hypothetical protein